jgi:NAD(P)-dependent dehydrogenase (short-subunit alcohol dehydrogenase family)
VSGRLAGKVAIVTGATEGIGLAVARAFVREGSSVVGVARRAEPGARLVAELGDRSTFVQGDVRESATAERAVRVAEETFGPLDVLVNNAGLDLSGVPLLDTTEAQAREIFDANVFGALHLLQGAARAMADRGGSIVNVTSRLAQVGLPGSAVYGASKGALSSLTRGAAVELARLSIRVNEVAPGLTETPMIHLWVAAQPDPEAFRRERAASIPLERFADPDDVAAAVVYLASDEARSVTGARIAVDGGYTAA